MDLNLVRVFVAVHETRGVTAAAARLHVTPPAVSQSLAKLRHRFDDELFIRQGRDMAPTALAQRLYPAFRNALRDLDTAIEGVHSFDPATTRRRFTIALSELGEIGWLPAIVRAMRSRAPGARLEVIPLEVGPLPEWLSRGTVDLAVTPATLPGTHDSVIIKTQSYGVVMSTKNPLAAAELTVEQYAAATHVQASGDTGGGQLEAAMHAAGISIDPDIIVNRVAALPAALAADPELIATVPDTIAAGWAGTWPLIVKPLPFGMAPLRVRLYRRQSTQEIGALDWFHATVSRAIRGSSGQFQVIHGDAAARTLVDSDSVSAATRSVPLDRSPPRTRAEIRAHSEENRADAPHELESPREGRGTG